MAQRKKKDSPAFAMIAAVWNGCCAETCHSWQRINQSMFQAVRLAITSGMKFDVTDFQRMKAEFRLGHWIGADNGERFYNDAIETGNLSAVYAYEEYRARRPFLIRHELADETPKRVCVGSRFHWYDKDSSIKLVTVTSFSGDQESLTAVTYKPRPEGKRCSKCGREDYQYHRETIDRRFRITHEAIKDHHRKLKQSIAHKSDVLQE
jgi:hypothetical protein